MFERLYDFLPHEPEDLVRLEPEEISDAILQWIGSIPDDERRSWLNRRSFGMHCARSWNGDSQIMELLSRVLLEGWMFLEHEGLLIPQPGDDAGWMGVSRRGEQLLKLRDFGVYRAARMLPREIVHPLLWDRVRPNFLRGDYEGAVFEAYKAVEIRVREACAFSNSEYGVAMMRKAFHPETGPLTDASSTQAERQATADLFAGAMGRFKNPGSHRNVDIGGPVPAAELVLFASHLMRIVEDRKEG